MIDVDEIIELSTSFVGPLWPLDQAVASNPLMDLVEERFESALASVSQRLGVSLWPSNEHVEEMVRRGYGGSAGISYEVVDVASRPGTLAERHFGSESRKSRQIRDVVGRVALNVTSYAGGASSSRQDDMVAAVSDSSYALSAPAAVRRRLVQILTTQSLTDILVNLGWDESALVEELGRHCARLPGWAGWAKWNDCWSPRRHHAAISRSEFLLLSLATDLAFVNPTGVLPAPRVQAVSQFPLTTIEEFDRPLHSEMLERLVLTPTSLRERRFQFVACIDVRSEPLRRALEMEDDVETFGFAGFFGIPATVRRGGEVESHDSLPVLLTPTADITGGRPISPNFTGRQRLLETFTELTHEPEAMFALAEGAGLMSASLMIASTFLPGLASSERPSLDGWRLTSTNPGQLAEDALRGMGLTSDFAREVVILGHGSHSSANTHYATLDCGACAANAGGANAAALVALLNDGGVREHLRGRGIDIPTDTRFVAGEYDTTTEDAVLDETASLDVRQRLAKASEVVRQMRTEERRNIGLSTANRFDRYSRDWAEVRPEWGLAGHVSFVIGPRSSSRGVDLDGRSFLHSYDADADADGSVLQSIFAGPVVVAQWINMAYYFSSVAPEVFGAGDKTLFNPVGDFGVMCGNDPDLRQGLPRQSLFVDDRPMHLPVRLLVAVEAPRDRVDGVVTSNALIHQLITGGWIVLANREHGDDQWSTWSADGWSIPS